MDGFVISTIKLGPIILTANSSIVIIPLTQYLHGNITPNIIPFANHPHIPPEPSMFSLNIAILSYFNVWLAWF